MNLYARATSDRASKGQGGNEYIVVEFTVGSPDNIIGQVELYLFDDGKHHGTDTDEWVLKFRNRGDEEDNDWDILAQDNIPNKRLLDYSTMPTDAIEKELKELQAFLGEETSSTGKRDYLMEQAMIKELTKRKGKRQKGVRNDYCTAGHKEYTEQCPKCADNIPF